MSVKVIFSCVYSISYENYENIQEIKYDGQLIISQYSIVSNLIQNLSRARNRKCTQQYSNLCRSNWLLEKLRVLRSRPDSSDGES